MKNKLSFLGIIAIIAIIGSLAACSGKKDGGGSSSGGKAETRAADDLLKALQGGDASAIEKALASSNVGVYASLASTRGAPGGDFSYDMNKDGSGIVIKKYSGAGGVVIIPATIEGIQVVEIQGEAFIGKHTVLTSLSGSSREEYGPGINIISVVIPEGVKTIGGSSFAGIENLTTVILPASLESIGGGAFSRCTNLHTINLPDGVVLRNQAFSRCSNLYNLTLPTSLKINNEGIFSEHYHFEGCQKLKLADRQKLKELGYEGNF